VITTVAGVTCENPSDYTAIIRPFDVAVDSAGTLYIADADHCRVLKITDGTATSIAGAPDLYPCINDGDGGSALAAHMASPVAVAVAANGDVYVSVRCEIRKISAGVITTVAGNQVCADGPDGP